MDNFVLRHQGNWFVREVLGMMRRTFARLEVTSRSLYAIAEPGCCFAGTLLELALAADRIYMRRDDEGEVRIATTPLNGGTFPMTHGIW